MAIAKNNIVILPKKSIFVKKMNNTISMIEVYNELKR